VSSTSIEVLLSNEDVTVLGPPEIVELSVDIGERGTRGSQIFVGTGNPNVIQIGQTPVLNDLFINTSPGEDYGYMYQYISQPGGNSWVEILRINPVIYSENHESEFMVENENEYGSSSIIIPISNIVTVSGTPLTAENFNIQYSIIHDKPVSSSITIPSLTTDDLVINVKAVQFDSGSWTPLSGEIITHVFVSIVF
jgi:hypothetical protein